tara:strand:+ start:651 stop:1121 length:471 start_codon:yes stop_codon:yes gene_type:complete
MQLANGITVVDNFLSKDLMEFLEDYYSHELPHYYGHRSTKEADPFYYCQIQPDPLHNFIWRKIKKEIGYELDLKRAYINVQHKHMEGTFHTDDGNLTILYMATQTLKQGIGCLEFKNGKKIDFIQNRLVWFKGERTHRGNAPDTYHPRITLVFKSV